MDITRTPGACAKAQARVPTARSHAALPAAVAQGQAQHALGLPRLAQDGQRRAMSQAHHVAVLHMQSIGIGRRQRQRVSPRGPGDRIRQFLEPSVVGIATVEKPWVGVENQFEAGGR